MENIERTFREESNVVVLYGMGGIGKSEICRKLFEDYSVHLGTNLVKKLGWISYEGSLQNSFFGQFPDIDSSSNDIKDYWKMAYSYLNGQGNELLLFLDNVNTISQKEVTELSRLGCKILLTSRKKLDRIFPIETDQLSIGECNKLYRTHSEDSESPDEVIDQIIELTARHTLSIELLAKTQCSAMMTTQELLQELKTRGFDLNETEITYQHNLEQEATDETEKRFIEHMSKIFDISEIKSFPEELRILQQVSLLAPNVPISREKIKSWLELENLNVLDKIVKKGWINRQVWNGTLSISIHLVIASVVQHMARPDADLADALIGHVADDLQLEPTEIFVERLGILVHAESIIKALDIGTVNYANLLHNAAYICYRQSEYNKASQWYQKALRIRENILGKEHPDTVASYNNIALVYFGQGEYNKALKCFQKVLNICKKILGKEDPNIAASYHNIADVYSRQGEYDKALQWFQKALKTREKVLGKKHPDTATSYHNIADVYFRQGEYDKALQWFQKALKIYENALDKEHLFTATAYNNIALVYSRQRKYNEALEWHQKALRIREKKLGREHPDTATSYHNIAFIYSSQGEYDKALQWYRKDLNICEKVLGKEHPDTATSYLNIADVYSSQGEYDKALEWYQKALKIREKLLGKKHPDTATAYNNIALVYFGQGEYNKALKWFEKALDIFITRLGKQHPSTLMAVENIKLLKVLYCSNTEQ